eukprot:UN1797
MVKTRPAKERKRPLKRNCRWTLLTQLMNRLSCPNLTCITRAFSRDKSLDSPLVSQCPCYQSLSTPIVIYCLSVRTISSQDTSFISRIIAA